MINTALEKTFEFISILFNISLCHSSLFLNSALLFNKINLLGLKGGIIKIFTLNKSLNKNLDFYFLWFQ